MRFLGGPIDRGRAWRVFATMAGHWALRGHGPFSIVRKSDGRWIGRAGPWTPEGSPGTEIGWMIARHAQGQGYAREAVTAAIGHAFDDLGWREVLHCIEPDNVPSIRFAEALGAAYVRDVHDLPGIGYSGVWRVYAQSAENWRARRS